MAKSRHVPEVRREIVEEGTKVTKRLMAQGSWLPKKTDVASKLAKAGKLASGNADLVHKAEWHAILRRVSKAGGLLVPTPRAVKALETALGLKIVLAHAESDIPGRAANWFLENVTDNSTVSVSCGRTLATMAEQIRGHSKTLTIYSSVCLCSDLGISMPPTAVASAFLHGQHTVSTLSYSMPKDLLRSLSLERDQLRRVLQRSLLTPATQADFVFFGVGTADPGTTFGAQLDAANARQHLKADFCGEVFFWPYNQEGEFFYDLAAGRRRVGTSARRTLPGELADFYNRTFTVAWVDLQRGKRPGKVIAVAGGRHKVDAIWVALRKLKPQPVVDVLITDPDTVDLLYDKLRVEPRGKP